MFCPKCGANNPDEGKFCRGCGTDISSVMAALMSPNAVGLQHSPGRNEKKKYKRNEPHEVFGEGVRSAFSGVGFLIVAMVLLFTGVAGGQAWWWAMLFPAFALMAKGISYIVKSRKMEAYLLAGGIYKPEAALEAGTKTTVLPASGSDVSLPSSRYGTDEPVPASVTENTTRHLEFNNENETVTLPQKPDKL